MAFLCPVRIRRNKKKHSTFTYFLFCLMSNNNNNNNNRLGTFESDLLSGTLSRPIPTMGRITGSASIETLVRVGIEKEHGLSPDSKMIVLHDFTPCVDDELQVSRGQIVNVLYQENDWVYVIADGQQNEGFIPFSYCMVYDESANLPPKRKMDRTVPLNLNIIDQQQQQQQPSLPPLLSSTASPSEVVTTTTISNNNNGTNSISDNTRPQFLLPSTNGVGGGGVGSGDGLVESNETNGVIYTPIGSLSPKHSFNSVINIDVANSSTTRKTHTNHSTTAAASIVSATCSNGPSHHSLGHHQHDPTTIDSSSPPPPPPLLLQPPPPLGIGQLNGVAQSIIHNGTSTNGVEPISGSGGGGGSGGATNMPLSEMEPFIKELFGRFIVLYQFISRHENEITVERGEIVTLLNKEDPDWYWVMRTDSVEGFVPAIYIGPQDILLNPHNASLILGQNPVPNNGFEVAPYRIADINNTVDNANNSVINNQSYHHGQPMPLRWHQVTS
ncbi:hypothetical protein BLOT_010150 [Blomia tropicalis]|nr:hypothetical protein BLOT_010150 [Blomia tropicalis]